MLAATMLTAAPAAWAVRPVVATPGSGAAELGDAHVDVIVFLVLQEGDRWVATVTGTPGDPVRARLLVPDRRPENRLQPTAMPTVEIGGPDGIALVARAGGSHVKEPATGIRLQEVVDSGEDSGNGCVAIDVRATCTSTNLAVGPKGRLEIAVVARGAVRVALVVGPDQRIEIPDAARQPRTIAGIRAWYDTAADGSPSTGGQVAQRPGRGWIAVPSTVVVAMVALALWWMLLGSRVGRRRGAERAAEREVDDRTARRADDSPPDSDVGLRP